MIEFKNVSKTYTGGVKAVDNLSLTVEDGELLVLLGTSGCGKTTTLKMINRLIEPTSGDITIDGHTIRDLDPIELRRGIGYAIQHIGLFPHLTVRDNIAVVPRLLNWSDPRIEERTGELLEMMGLEPDDFRDRYPAQLSGGQKQRIGVARALAANPDIVLMDEPFGALDPITREQLQEQFLDLQKELRKTIVFVTHDVFEAVKIGDRIAILDEGRLMQVDAPANIVESPAHKFVDRFLGRHRFQLLLITETLKGLIEESGQSVSDPGGDDRLHVFDSLVDGLDTFKRTRREVLPVFDREGRQRGVVRRKKVLQAMASSIEETGQVDRTSGSTEQ
jgi:osmoprotectant transport system ATP-binding protein